MTSTINIKTDAELKKQAEELFSDLGMNIATAFNIFLRQSVRENRIPFEITRDTPNAETLQAIEDVKSGRNMSVPFDSMKDLAESLNA